MDLLEFKGLKPGNVIRVDDADDIYIAEVISEPYLPTNVTNNYFIKTRLFCNINLPPNLSDMYATPGYEFKLSSDKCGVYTLIE